MESPFASKLNTPRNSTPKNNKDNIHSDEKDLHINS